MRFIRLLFVLTLAVLLLAIALANRGAVTLKAFPASLDQYFGGSWQVTVPLFLVIFLAIVFGIIVGFIWEWLREAHLRAESKARAQDLARLQREVGDLRRTHAAPMDEVLAILDDAPARGPRNTAPAANLPAPR